MPQIWNELTRVYEDSYGESVRAWKEAEYVLNLGTKEKRHAFLEAVGRARGANAVERIKADVVRLNNLRKQYGVTNGPNSSGR